MLRLGQVAAISALMLAPGLHAQAQACPPKPSATDAAHGAAVVFEGRVERFFELKTQPPTPQVQLHAVRAWKGVEGESLALDLSCPAPAGEADPAHCAYPFQLGQSYFVYAEKTPAGLFTSRCSRTQPIESADADIAELGMGVVPFSPRPPNTTPSDQGTLPPGARGCGCDLAPSKSGHSLAAVLALLVAIALTRAKRRAKQRSS